MSDARNLGPGAELDAYLDGLIASRNLDGLDLARIEAHRRDPSVTPVFNALLNAVASYGTAVLDDFQAQPWAADLFHHPEHQAQALAWLEQQYPPAA